MKISLNGLSLADQVGAVANYILARHQRAPGKDIEVTVEDLATNFKITGAELRRVRTRLTDEAKKSIKDARMIPHFSDEIVRLSFFTLLLTVTNEALAQVASAPAPTPATQ